MPPPDMKESRNDLAFTGERFIPHQTDPLLALEHYHRYHFASRFARNRRILDIGCGEGYGSAFLAQQANAVIGIDRDQATIGHARNKYSSIPNLTFEVGNCEEIRKDEQSFDMAVSFELLEHLDPDNQVKFLQSVQRMLKPDGLFLVSSPERDEYAATYQARNEFHKHEMTVTELKAFLCTFFRHVQFCGQRVLSYSTMWQLEDWRDTPFHFHCRKDLLQEIPSGESFASPLYLIALCSNAPLPADAAAESNSLYMDVSNSDQTKDFSGWAQRLNSEVQKNRESIRNLEWQLEERTAWALDQDNRIQVQRERILTLDKELEDRTRWALSLESEVAKERAYATECSQEISRIRREASSSLIYRVLAKMKLIPNVEGK
jgi:O-antigen biosynthesis protein